MYAYYRLTSLTEILITNHIAQFDVLIFFFYYYSTLDIIYISQQPIIILYIRDKFTTDAQNVLLVMIAPGNLIYYITSYIHNTFILIVRVLKVGQIVVWLVFEF